jgi:hypothetical protein
MSGGSDIDMNTSAPQVKEVEPMEDIQDSAQRCFHLMDSTTAEALTCVLGVLSTYVGKTHIAIHLVLQVHPT